MKSESEYIEVRTYTSDVVPDVSSTSAADAPIIAWADAHPVVWKIVIGSKSAPFGKNASTYMGCQRGDSTGAILGRLATFMDLIERSGQGEQEDSLWTWRARFTLNHYGDKGFKGGVFKQFDGTYERGCIDLDYTPDTREVVIDRFLAWCDAAGHRFPTESVSIDGKVVRRLSA